VLYGVVRLRGEEYRVGTSVFLRPGSFKFKTSAPVTVTKKDNSKDRKVCVIISPILQICRWLLSTGTPYLPMVQENYRKLCIVSIFRLMEWMIYTDVILKCICLLHKENTVLCTEGNVDEHKHNITCNLRSR
jgi:hypothetical protein